MCTVVNIGWENITISKKEVAYQEVRDELKKVKSEKDQLEARLLDVSKELTEPRISQQALQEFKQEVRTWLESIQKPTNDGSKDKKGINPPKAS